MVCNDDGYDTRGIRDLAQALGEIADVHVCAPLRNCSGASSSLTVSGSVSATFRKNLTIVDGTPADCVHLALLGNVLPWKPDLTVSGINNGGNLGDDTIYSGTVSAAAESMLLGVPAIAFSLACVPEYNFPPTHFAMAASIARELVQKLSAHMETEPNMVLNVNIPDLPKDKVKEPVACVLGKCHPERPVTEIGNNSDLGIRRYQIGISGKSHDSLENPGGMTDFEAIEAGHVSVTPLDFNMTETERMAEIESWVKAHAVAQG